MSCMLVKSIKDTPLGRKKEYHYSYESNKNNNCKYYIDNPKSYSKWFKFLLNFIDSSSMFRV